MVWKSFPNENWDTAAADRIGDAWLCQFEWSLFFRPNHLANANRNGWTLIAEAGRSAKLYLCIRYPHTSYSRHFTIRCVRATRDMYTICSSSEPDNGIAIAIKPTNQFTMDSKNKQTEFRAMTQKNPKFLLLHPLHWSSFRFGLTFRRTAAGLYGAVLVVNGNEIECMNKSNWCKCEPSNLLHNLRNKNEENE